jgi:hypothetical protein
MKTDGSLSCTQNPAIGLTLPMLLHILFLVSCPGPRPLCEFSHTDLATKMSYAHRFSPTGVKN